MSLTEQQTEVAYPDDEIIYDNTSLRHTLKYEKDAMMLTYVEQHFREESYSYQLGLMLKFPFFGHKIIEDYELDNFAKQDVLLNNLVYNDKSGGKIILVDGARGGGKTGFGCWLLDQFHERKPFWRYYFVTKSETKPQLPSWIKIVGDINRVKNNSIALIDEGAIQLSSRRSMSMQNTFASELFVTLRQKGITIIVLVQDVNMVDINARRLADVRALKFGIPFGIDQKQRGMRINKNLMYIRQRLTPRNNREVYIEIPSKKIYHKFKHGLPDWFDTEKTSKYMKNWNMGKAFREKLNKDRGVLNGF